MLNVDLYKDYFDYAKEYGYSYSMSFKEHKFFSYNTLIGKQYRGKGDKRILFVNICYFSSTSSSHVYTLVKRAVDEGITVIPFVGKKDMRNITVEEVKADLTRRVLEAINEDSLGYLRYSRAKKEFIYLMNNVVDFATYIEPLDIPPKAYEIADNLCDSEYIEEHIPKAVKISKDNFQIDHTVDITDIG